MCAYYVNIYAHEQSIRTHKHIRTHTHARRTYAKTHLCTKSKHEFAAKAHIHAQNSTENIRITTHTSQYAVLDVVH